MIIYIKNNKGGVGKSSISRNLAHAFALKNTRVALVSFDSQNDSLILLGKEFKEKKGLKYYAQYGENIKIKVRENLDYYPLETNQIGIALTEKMEAALSRLDEEYDLVIIDGAPSKDDLLSKIAINMSDQIIIPILLDILSLKAIKRLLETLPPEKVSCVIPNRFNRTKDEIEIYEGVERFFEDTPIYLTPPIHLTAFENRLGIKGKSIYDSRSKQTFNSKLIYNEIMDVIISWD